MAASDATLDAAELRDALVTESDGPQVLSWDSRARRVVTIYLPLACFLLILLFPFYWMAITAFKPDSELLDYKHNNPFWIHSPTLQNIRKLLFETDYPHWLATTMGVALGATVLSLVASVLAAYAIQRLRFRGSNYVGLAIYIAYLVPPSILFIPLAQVVFDLGLFDSPFALVLTYPTFLIPFCTWLMMGYFKAIPRELEECARIDGASRIKAMVYIIFPIAVPGILSAGIFAFTLSWNEFIYALVFLSSPEQKTVPVGVTSELIRGDVFFWGPLMAGALLGSIPVAVVYSFFVENYVAGLTGSVKG